MPIDSPQQDWNRIQAQKILECGFASHSLVQRYLLSSHGSQHVDLCESLHKAGQLTQEQAEFVRSAAKISPSSDSSFIATVVSPPRPSLLAPSGTNPAPAPEALKPESQFERIESLGKGGMGEVFLVKDPRLKREAALKVVNKNLDNLEGLQRFLKEAEFTARLDHPSIPPVYEVGRNAEGEQYMLMKVIRGETLKDQIEQYHKQGCSEGELRKLLSALTKVAEAVAYAHSQGIIHRDLKPANIMVGAFGEVMVLDWGLARELDAPVDDDSIPSSVDPALLSNEGLTVVGAIVGTPGFMAPEQARGEVADAQSDVYGLGAILTYLLTKQCPVKGDNVIQLTLAAAMGKIHSPKSLKKRVDPELSAIAVTATKEKKDERLSSAQGFARELQRFLSREPVSCYRYSFGEKVQRWTRKHPLILLSLIALTVTAFLLTQINLVLRSEAEARENEKRAKQQSIEQRRLLDNLELAKQLARDKVNPTRFEATIEEIRERADKDPYLFLNIADLYRRAGNAKKRETSYQEALKYPETRARALLELHFLETKRQERSIFHETEYLTRLSKEGSEETKDTVFSLWVRAVNERRQKRYEDCIATCTQLIEKHSKDFAFAYYCRAHAKLMLKDYQSSMADLLETIQLNPEFTLAYVRYMRLLARDNRFAEAIQFYKSIPPSIIDQIPINQTIAWVLLQNKQQKKALVYYDRVNEQYQEARTEKLEKIGEWRDSGANFIEMKKANSVRFYMGYIRCLLMANRRENLREYFLRAQSLNCKAEGALVELIKTAFLIPLIPEAEISIRELERLYPENVQIWEFRILLALGKGDGPKAHSLSKAFLEKHPELPVANYSRGLTFQALNQVRKSLPFFEKVIEKTPRRLDARRRRVDILLRLRRYKEALEDVQFLLKQEAANPYFRFQYGVCCANLGQFSQGITEFTRLINEDPRMYNAFKGRGQIYTKLRLFRLAEKDYSQAIEAMSLQAPKRKPVQLLLLRAQVREAQNNKVGAIEDYRQYLKLIDPRRKKSIAAAEERLRILRGN